MAKDKQPRKPRAETPKGFRDYFGADVIERRDMLAKISAVYERYGFDPLETSAVETVEALGKFLPDVDRPNEGVFGWQDEDGDWLALRYDLTAPLARVFPNYSRHDLELMTRALFSSVHGIVLLGLQKRISGVPLDKIEDMIAILLSNVTSQA